MFYSGLQGVNLNKTSQNCKSLMWTVFHKNA